MKISLIFCPFSHKKFEEDLPVVSQEFGVYPPLGLAYAAAILEKEGHEVILIDANALKLTKEETLKRIMDFKPKLLGFMLTTYMFQDTLEWIKYLKRKTNLPVVVGNINVELYPKETLSHEEIDYGIIGPAQKNLPELVAALENNKDISNIKGLTYKKNGKIIINKPESLVEDFSTLPFPARHLLPNDRYKQYISKRKNFTIAISSRGCPHKCDFCYVNQIPYRVRDVNDFVNELEECYKRYGVREFDFFEPDFIVNKKRVFEICNEILKRKLRIYWSCRGRVNEADEDLLKIMKRAGCCRIYYGIESGSQEILDKENKGITLEQIRKAVKLTKKKGIKVLGFLMIGQQGDTIETAKKTIKFAKELNLDYVQIGRTIPKPRSYLDEITKKATGRDYWRDYVLGKEKERRIETPWTELTEEQKLELVKEAYKQIYFSPSYIIKTLFKIKSLDELKRYTRAGLSFVFGNMNDLK